MPPFSGTVAAAQQEVAVVEAPPVGPHHRAALLPDVPGGAQARREVVVVVAEEARLVVAQAEVQGHAAARLPRVLHVAAVVLVADVEVQGLVRARAGSGRSAPPTARSRGGRSGPRCPRSRSGDRKAAEYSTSLTTSSKPVTPVSFQSQPTLNSWSPARPYGFQVKLWASWKRLLVRSCLPLKGAPVCWKPLASRMRIGSKRPSRSRLLPRRPF